MSDDERLLHQLWAEDEPPARDAAFVLEAVQRLERRRLWWNLAGLVPLGVAAAAALWGMAPQLADAGASLTPLLQPANAAAIVGALVCAWLLLRTDLARAIAT